MFRRCAVRVASGRIVEWDSLNRTGIIEADPADDGSAPRRFHILSPRVFETIVPSHIRSLKGTRVTSFEPEEGVGKSSAHIYHKGTWAGYRPHASMMPHKDLLASHEVTLTKAAAKGDIERSKFGRSDAEEGDIWTAHKIVLDLSTAPQLTKAERAELRTRDYVKKGSLLRLGQVDLRPRSLFNTAEEFAMIEAKRLRRPYEEVLKEFLEEEEEERQLEARTKDLSSLAGKKVVTKEDKPVPSATEAASSSKPAEFSRPVVYREFVEKEVLGVVVAWSSVTRSGVCIQGSLEEGLSLEEQIGKQQIYVIKSVDSFISAMPNAINLRGREVKFSVVSYTEAKGARYPNLFAEEIVVQGDLEIFNADNRTKGSDSAPSKKPSKIEEPRAVVEGTQYGVITRWSGGQGTVEGSNGDVFFIERGSDFDEAVDVKTNAAALRGAVVTFVVDAARPQFAASLRLLSTPQPTNREVKTVPFRLPQTSGVPATGVANMVAPVIPAPATVPPTSDPRWLTGVLSSWSAVEGSGIIQLVLEEDPAADPLPQPAASSSSTAPSPVDRLSDLNLSSLGAEVKSPIVPPSRTPVGTWVPNSRFVLRDPSETIVSYDEHKLLLKKGRKVHFIPGGSTGKICQFVMLDMSEVSEEELKSIEEKERGTKTPSVALEEGEYDPRSEVTSEIAQPPTNGAYWFARAERAGFDMSELRAMKGREGEAVDPTRDDPRKDMEGNKGIDLNDPIEVLENDPWFKDPSKNKKFPNSDMRYGDMQRTSPIAMMSLANKVRDPKKLEETKDKYYNKLTEPMKEWCWQQAKEQAPRFEQRIKEAKMKGTEPTFHYF